MRDKALVWGTNAFIVSPILVNAEIHSSVSFTISPLNSPVYSTGLFPKAAHDLFCSLRGNSLNSLYWFCETPSTMAIPSAPGETTSIRRMYLEAVRGLFQIALCMIVAVEGHFCQWCSRRRAPRPGCAFRIIRAERRQGAALVEPGPLRRGVATSGGPGQGRE